MKQFEVGVTPPYPVTVGVGLFPQLGELLNGRDVAVIADANVSRLFGEQLLDCLGAPEAGGQTSQARRELFEIPSGEGSKSVKVYGELLEKLAVAGFGRDAAVVALGGGVTTDLAGFVAATYMRGVDFYSFPTSLLAMVDASLGGKTGINLTAGKNLAGAFWQPRAVLVDVAVLRTLPDHLFRDGAVELFKHGLLACPPLLGALDDPEFTPAGAPVPGAFNRGEGPDCCGGRARSRRTRAPEPGTHPGARTRSRDGSRPYPRSGCGVRPALRGPAEP